MARAAEYPRPPQELFPSDPLRTFPEHMFPASRIPRPLLRALDVAVEFATLGEVRLDPGWEELAWLDDEGLRSEWFREVTPPAPDSLLPRARVPFKPATPAGRLALEAATAAEPASRPPVCSGARGARAATDASGPPRGRVRGGAVEAPLQPCLWDDQA
jgi:hypothetical protein